ncbi:MAG: conjugal transfer protein TraI [Ferruginibacter sp.]|uniref:conjugal transfer protein TraI n=1 Tax=Ferruginibacter sp. TaxID=1940288 RepID=UPI00265AFEAB|nr:conjugal transfer protein TraI [Ferruginibacter sp.]MDB5277932.1 conjugal transfer protein TraI [Ferruginibacter sp.]
MKCVVMLMIVFFLSLDPVTATQAQIPVLDIIKAGITKVIKAVDLQIQRLQNKTVWLQNAQKVLENKMSKLKLTEISNWANKQKELYANYFDELWKVKAVIGTYQSVKNIIQQQLQLVKEFESAFNLSKQDKNFTPQEIDYMQQVYSAILDESLKNMNQLELVINAFATQMSDAKRLEIIHSANDHMDQQLTDLRQFNQQNIKISLQRAKEKNELDAVKQLYGLQ